MKKVYIFCHYHNQDEILRLLAESDFKSSGSHCYIVDNSNDFKESSDVNVIVLKPGSNLGYFNGFDYAINEIRNRSLKYEWFIFGNTDVEFSSFSELERALESAPVDIVCWSPIVVDLDGRVQNPHLTDRLSLAYLLKMKLICESIILWRLFTSTRYFVKRVLRLYKKKIPLRSRYVYAPHGSFFALRDTFFRQGGSLKFGAFLFNEEAHLGEQLKRNGQKAICDSSFLIRHVCHSATGRIEGVRKMKMYAESYAWIINTYYR